jgi:hypothetical protein
MPQIMNDPAIIQRILDSLPPEKLLEAAIAEFEKGRNVIEGQPCNRSQTGEEYTVIANGQIVEEGVNYPNICRTTPEGAIQTWFDGIMLWADGKPGAIYWRRRPELIRYKANAWKVYSRLLISDKPVIYMAS